MESTIFPQELSGVREYEVLEKIADGSMASVYKARRRVDNALVAIKVPLPAVANNDVLRIRFRKEYLAGKSLNHPNIVRALDFGQTDSTFYLVMEFVTGPDLWQRIEQEGRLPEQEAVRVIVEAAQGLHHAHQHGIIHRDVKPDNIILTAGGQAKLADLGLIKELESQHDLTRPDKGLGTPNFMSPEQFTEACKADVRCDVYSLGATLYMAVTGIMPFHANSMALTLRKKIDNELKPPRQIVPNLSRAVDWTIRRAMQADPQRRHAGCQEFIQSLYGEFVAPAEGRGDGQARRPRHPAKEHRRAVRYPCTAVTLWEVSTSIHLEETEALNHWKGKVLNLSATGIGLLLERRFEPGTVATAVLENQSGTFKVRAVVRVVRSLRSDGNQWLLGAAFTEPLEKETLRKLLWKSLD